jgi:hypothetical protein
MPIPMKVLKQVFAMLLCFSGQMSAFSQSNPIIDNIITNPSSCRFGPCNLCPGNTLELSLTGTNLPNGSNVLWYYSTNPSFDPYTGGAGVNLIGSGIISTTPATPPITPCTTCPELVYLQVDGCPGSNTLDQLRGEFAIVSSGSGFNLSDLRFSFDPTLVSANVNSNIGFGTCSWAAPTQAMVNTVRGLCPCTNVIGVVPGQVIPPNSYLVLYPNGAGNTPTGQNFAGLCGKASQIYVAQNSCARSNISFLNFDSGPVGQTRTQILSLASCGCSQSVTYNLLGNPPSSIGDIVTIDGGTVTQSSPGCPSSPNPPQLLLNSVNNPSSSSPVNLIINTGLCNNGPFYIKPAINPWLDPNCPKPTLPLVPSFNVGCPSPTATHFISFCSGDTLFLQASGGNTYLWSGPNGFTSSLQNPIITPFTSSLQGFYRVTVNSGGCSGTAVTNVSSLSSNAIASFNGPLCEGNALNLRVTPAGTSYSWNGPNGFVSTLQNPIINPVTLGTAGTYNVTVTYPGGCTSTSSVAVIVNPIQPYIPIPTTICSNNGSLNLSTTLNPPAASGVWTGPGVAGGIFNPSGIIGPVVLTFFPSGSCAPPPVSVQITVLPAPTVIASNNGPIICSSDEIILKASGGTSYSWSGPGITNNSRDQNPILNKPASPGTYTVTVTSGGCSATGSTVVHQQLVPFQEAPSPTKPATSVKSLFSNSYPNLSVDTWRTPWSVGTLEDVRISNNDTKKYCAVDFVGIETVTNQVDISTMTFVHLDIWTSNITSFGLKLVDFGANAIFGGGDDVEHQVNILNPLKNQWVSLDIPLSDFIGLTTRKNIAQYILVGVPTGTSNLFVDNFYFHNVPLSTIEPNSDHINLFPNPVTKESMVQLSEEFKSIEMINILGQTVLNSFGSTFSVRGIQSGLYMVKLKDSLGKIYTKKMVVE